MDCSTPDFPVLHFLPEFAQTHVLWVSDAIQPCHPLSPPSPLALSLSQHQLFASGAQNFEASAPASVLPMNIQAGSPCSQRDSQESSQTPPFKSINSSALNFLHNQLSHPYMTTGKTIALTRRTFVGKVMFLLFNMLYRLAITFLPRTKRLLISWLHHHLQWFWSPPK